MQQQFASGYPMQQLPPMQDPGWTYPFTLEPSKIMNTPSTTSLNPMQQPMTANSFSTHPVTASSMSDESRHQVAAPFPMSMMGTQQSFVPGFAVPSMQYNSLGALLNATSMNVMHPQQTVKEDSPTPFAFSVPPEPTTADAQPPWNPWMNSNTGYPSTIQQPQQYSHPQQYPSASAVATDSSYPYPQTGNPHNVLPLTAHHQQLMQQQFPHAFRTSTATTMGSTTSSEVVANVGKKLPAAMYGFYASTPPNDLVQRSFSTVAPAYTSPVSYASDTFVTPQYQLRQSTSTYPVTPLGRPQPIPTYPGTPLDSQRQSTIVEYPITPLDTHGSRRVVVVQSLSPDVESRSPDDVEMASSKVCVEENMTKSGRKGKKGGDGKTGPNFLTKLYDVLSNPAYHHILHWDTDGRQIVIRKPRELEAHILPLVYKQSKFASFSRQLNIYGFMRKMTVKQGEATRECESSVWTHYELDQFSKREQLMSYKRRVGPRTYGRKKGGRAALPVLGEGARYEFIDTPEPASPKAKVPPLGSSPVQSLVSPSSTLTELSPTASSSTRPIRNVGKTHRMSAGTLPMPLSSSSRNRRGSSVMYQISPRSVPYGSVAVRHAPMDRRQGPEVMPGVAVQGTLWQQMLAATGAQAAAESMSASSYMQMEERPIGPEISNTRHAIPQPTFVPIHQASQPFPSGTKYRATVRPYPQDDKLLDTFNSIDIHSLASVRSVVPKSEHAASGHTFSYLNDLSTDTGAGSMSVAFGGRAGSARVDGKVGEREGVMESEGDGEGSPPETIRAPGLIVKVEDCDDDPFDY